MRARSVAWRRILPSHRLPVIAKTPLLALVGVYIAHGHFASPQVLMTMLLGAGLWAVLYTLNEATDRENEQGLEVETRIRASLLAGCTLICALGTLVAAHLGLLLALMALGQVTYCIPPLRMKRYWWAVLLLSGTLNPILRLECGAIWGTQRIPLPVYAVFISLHLGAAILTRCLLRQRDAELGYHIAPPYTEWLGVACTAGGLLGAYALCWVGILPRFCLLFTTVGVSFAVYAWSGRAKSLSRLRRGWLLFALMALLTLATLLIQSLLVGTQLRKTGGHKNTERLRQNAQPHRRLAA